jgi:hypothetical protein
MKHLNAFRHLGLGAKALLFGGWLTACAGSDGTSPNGAGYPTTTSDNTAPMVAAATANGRGLLELRLVDAPATDVTEIVVTITRVEAHVAGGGGWMVLGDKTATIDLLKLQGGTFAQLGVVQMPAGKVTQLRLYVKEDGPNYVTTPDGKQHPLTVPSGTQSGIKLKGQFDWPNCGIGNVTIDFDGKKSIFTHPKGAGAGDEWLLRPVVRLKSISVKEGTCGPAPDAGVPNENPSVPGSDAGTGDPTPPPPPPPPPTMPPTMPPVMNPPPGDPCAAVTCGDGLVCYNGACLQVVD